MRIVIPMVTMLVAGLTLGSVATTLLWKGPIDRRDKLIERANQTTESALTADRTNLTTANECIAALNKFVSR